MEGCWGKWRLSSLTFFFRGIENAGRSRAQKECSISSVQTPVSGICCCWGQKQHGFWRGLDRRAGWNASPGHWPDNGYLRELKASWVMVPNWCSSTCPTGERQSWSWWLCSLPAGMASLTAGKASRAGSNGPPSFFPSLAAEHAFLTTFPPWTWLLSSPEAPGLLLFLC